MTARPPGGSPSGAARFSGPTPSPGRRRRFPAVLATIALLALIIGVPVVLLLLANPIQLPTTWPPELNLTHSVDTDQVLNVLVIVVWLAWLQFIACVAVEVVAALRGGVLAGPIPLSGPSQRLARMLVASVLLAGTVVGQAGLADAATNPAADAASSSGRAVVAAAAPFANTDDMIVFTGDTPVMTANNAVARQTARQVTTRQVAAVEATARRAASGNPASTATDQQASSSSLDKEEQALDGHKVYVVTAPAGRHHDSLWAIAERHLGDGRRYQEIYRLNEGRLQPDGRTLHLARLIHPGWRLVMPEDAVGVARYVADRSAPAPSGRSGSDSSTAGGSASGGSEGAGAGGPAAAIPPLRRIVPPGHNLPSTAKPKPSAKAATPARTAPPGQEVPVPPVRVAPSAVASAPALDAPTPSLGTARSTTPHPTTPPATHRPAASSAAAPSAAAPSAAAPSAAAPSAAANPDQPSPAASPQPDDVNAGDPAAETELLSPALIGGELIGAGLLAAALLGTLLVIRRRRGTHADPDPEAADAEVWLRAGADADRGALLDLALRSLSRSCRDVNRPLPQAYGAVVDDDGLDLLLTMSHPSPPPPWTPTDEGLRWRVTYADAQHLVPDGESAYPLLASVGRDPQGRDALVNLGAAAGPVAVVGSPAMAAAVVRALALGLAGNPWSRGIEVLTADLPPALPAIAAGRLVPCAGARDLTDQLEQGSGRMPRTGPIQILTGGPAPGSRPERVAVYGAPLNAPIAQRLQALVVRRSDLAVLVTGELPGASWRLKVDDAGNLSCDELSLNVAANRLGDGSIERLHALFISAATVGPRSGVLPERAPDADGLVETDDVTWAQAPVRVAILGEVEVRAAGMIEAARLPLAGEIVAYLALHPVGAHPTVLASAVWPRGVTGDVRDGTLEQVRDWLGTDPDGAPRLREGSDGRMRLSPEVPCDWDVFRTLVNRADQSPEPSRERDLLVRALHLVRGPVVGGITHGTYTWLPRTDLERQAEELIVQAADRLSRICAEQGDLVAVEQAAAAGLRAVPEAQHLWRHIIRAEHALGGPTRLARVIEHLHFALTTSGVDLEPETQALIEHLSSVSATSDSAASNTGT
jgi:nucleoid-associated protein YgaU